MKQGITIRPTSPALFPDLEFWFDGKATDSFTLDGTSVDQWNDLSGNARHVLNAAGDATRPTYDAATGRVTFVQANGTFLQSAAFASALAQPNTVFVVYKLTNIAGVKIMFDSRETSAAYLALITPNFTAYAGTSQEAGAADTNDNVHVCEFNGATSRYWINGTLVASGRCPRRSEMIL